MSESSTVYLDGTAPDGTPICLSSDLDVEVVDHNMTDEGVVRAARVSTVGEESFGEQAAPGRQMGLIKYLMRHRHGSPFEHNYVTFLVRAPIFAVRHLMRHRTWSFNEESARYREMSPRFYVPDPERELRQEGRPGHYTYVMGDEEDYRLVLEESAASYRRSYEAYRAMLDSGITRELARAVLPSATYSSLYATCNARALMHFLSLRTLDDTATYPSSPQKEIHVIASKMEDVWARLMPDTHRAYNEFGRVSP